MCIDLNKHESVTQLRTRAHGLTTLKVIRSAKLLTLVSAVGVSDRRRKLEDVDGEVAVHVLQLLRVEHHVDSFLSTERWLHLEFTLGFSAGGDRTARKGRSVGRRCGEMEV